jgi:hypothetical protein
MIPIYKWGFNKTQISMYFYEKHVILFYDYR